MTDQSAPNTDRRAALANELEYKLGDDIEHTLPRPTECEIADVRLIIDALRAHLWEDVIGKHSGNSDRRERWSGSEWLYPGDEIVSRRTRI